MKNLSFGALLGICAGGFVLLMIIAFVVIKLMAPAPPAKQVVLSKGRSALSEQLTNVPTNEALEIQRRATAEASAAADAKVREVLAQQNVQRDSVNQQLRSIAQGVESINNRVIELEATQAASQRNRGVSVVKPEPKPLVVEAVKPSYKPLPGSANHKVLATVGKTVWVDSEGEQRVVGFGEAIRVGAKDVTVRAVDTETNAILIEERK